MATLVDKICEIFMWGIITYENHVTWGICGAAKFVGRASEVSMTRQRVFEHGVFDEMLGIVTAMAVRAALGKDTTWGIIEARGMNKSAMLNIWIPAARKSCIALGKDITCRICEA